MGINTAVTSIVARLFEPTEKMLSNLMHLK